MTFPVADVADYQGTNITGIINENNAVIVKATEGTGFTNPCYQSQVDSVLNAGKLLGLYHFIRADFDVKEQAQHFLDVIGDLATNQEVALILDFENNKNYPTLSGNEPRVFADYIKEKTGKKIWLYISNNDIRGGGHGYTWEDMADHAVWVAGYPYSSSTPVAYSEELQNWANGAYFTNMPTWQDKVTMWQYSSNGYDKSVFYGDAETWKHLAAGGDVTPQPTEYVAPAPVQDVESANDKFRKVGNRFILQGAFRVDDIQEMKDGSWRIRSNELCADPFDWKNNGIDTRLVDNATRPGERDFEIGEYVTFKQKYNHGTIDQYCDNINAVGIDMVNVLDRLYFGSDKLWNHA